MGRFADSVVAELYRQLRFANLSNATILRIMDGITGLDYKDEVNEPEADFTAEATNSAPPEEHTYLPEDKPEPTPEPEQDSGPDLYGDAVPPETEPEPAPEPEKLDPNKSYTRDDIRNAMRPLVAVSREQAVAILQKYGAGNISDLAEEHFPVVMVELTNAVKA